MRRSRIKHSCKLMASVAIVLNAVVFLHVLVGAQTPILPSSPPSATPIPTSLPPSPVELRLTVDAEPDSLLPGAEVDITLTLAPGRRPNIECTGILGDPLDAYFVIDNSASAGTGRGSNIALTQQWLLDWLAQAEPAVFYSPAGLPQRIRLGVVASRVTTEGTELLWQTLTEDYEQLRRAVAALGSGGDTSLAPGIQQAITALQQRGRPNARHALMLILHDRLPLTDETLAALESARQAGIEIYLFVNSLNLKSDEVVTLTTAPFVDAARFWLDPDAPQRQHILVQITGGTDEYLAQDMQLTVSHLPPGLTVVSSTGAEETAMVWPLAYVTEGEAVETTYRVKIAPELAGQDRIAIAAQITYRDCSGIQRTETFTLPLDVAPARFTSTPEATPLVVTPAPEKPGGNVPLPTVEAPAVQPPVLSPLPQGPLDQLFAWWVQLIPAVSGAITPLIGNLPIILQWLLIVVLLILLLLLLGWLIRKLIAWLRHRKSSTPPVPPEGGGGSRSPLAEPSMPKWLTNLRANILLPEERSPSMCVNIKIKDTFLIGVGPAGREVLTKIAAALNGRFGGGWPPNVRLLQVDVSPEGDTSKLSAPEGIPSENWVLLRPNIQQMEENLRRKPEDWPHWEWYVRTVPDYGRARGRLAFFNDVRSGITDSLLWKAIQNGIRELNAPAVRVIGTTFDDVSSGMLVDILRLVQIVCSGPDGTPPAQLWLAGPVRRDWSDLLGRRGQVRADEQRARTLATLRELERFQHNAPVEYRYLKDASRQEELYRRYNFAVVNDVLLFEPAVNPPTSPEDDVFVCMSNALLAMLDLEACRQWEEQLIATRSYKNELVNKEGRGAVLTMGCYVVRHPTLALREALAWRMVRDVLFETTLGLMPLEQQDESTGEYQSLPEVERGVPLKTAPPLHMEDLETFLYRYEGYFNTDAFSEAVRHRVNDFLNGEQETGLSATLRRAGLAQAIRWLTLLRSALLQHDAPDIARQVEDLRKQLSDWQRWLRDKAYPVCKQNFEAARLKLQRLRTQPAQTWGMGADLEWPLYRRFIRAWGSQPVGTGQSQPLLRLTERFGWEVEITTRGWRARLIVPPGEWADTLNARTLDAVRPCEYALPNADPGSLLQALFLLAERAARVAAPFDLTETALDQDAKTWLEHAEAKLRLRYDDDKAAQLIPRRNLHLLVTPESFGNIDKLKQHLNNAPNRPTDLRVCSNDDATSITLIEAINWVPLSTVALYAEEVWDTVPVPETFYVWSPEQIAAGLERRHRLSPLLVSRIAENEPLLRAFGLAFIYGILEQDSWGWRIPEMEEPVSGNLPVALEAVFKDDRDDLRAQKARLEALQQAIEQRKSNIPDLRAFLLQAKKERVEPLEASTETLMRDLAEYLYGLIDLELRS